MIRSSEAWFTADRLSYIDPELSIRIPSDTGKSSCRNELIVCGTPSSYTWNESFVRSSTDRPSPSSTVAFSRTS